MYELAKVVPVEEYMCMWLSKYIPLRGRSEMNIANHPLHVERSTHLIANDLASTEK